MKKTLLTIIFVACAGFAIAQTVPQQIAALERRINLDNDQIGNDNAEINPVSAAAKTLPVILLCLALTSMTGCATIGQTGVYVAQTDTTTQDLGNVSK